MIFKTVMITIFFYKDKEFDAQNLSSKEKIWRRQVKIIE
jgi:hypothetical protein